MNEPEVVRAMLGIGGGGGAHTIAVVGLSDNPAKASYYVSEYMQQQGYTVLPVNPAIAMVLGQKAYGSLADLPVRPDVVNVFRLPTAVPEIVDAMIALGLKNLWTQQGIVHLEAAARAGAAGIRVVMDRCMMVEHRRLSHA